MPANNMLHAVIEKLSNYPRLFLFCRGLFESNFIVIRSTIREHLGSSPERRVIDVACGPGAFSDLFDEGSYTGIDLNPNYVRYAREHYRGTFELQDARALDFPQGSFDDALVYGLLHHLDDVDVGRVANSLRRVVRPAGRILVIEDVPTESRLNLVGHLLHCVENGHYIRPAERYHALLEPHFRIEEERQFRSGVCDYYLARLINDEEP
ncbi:MAG TPA: class I SAM-dependent methyltransferase [Vicinamibacteria bacterium]|nr:class I SAM-dependent methyltransferase [Vicinamibacteria bacterium]